MGRVVATCMAAGWVLLALAGCDDGGGGGGASTLVADAQVDDLTIRLETPTGKLESGVQTVTVAVNDTESGHDVSDHVGRGREAGVVAEAVEFVMPREDGGTPMRAVVALRPAEARRFTGTANLPSPGTW